MVKKCKCVVCGKEFETTYPSKKTCSDECKHAHWVISHRAANLRYRNAVRAAKPPKADKVCVICGASFTPRADNQKCCSTPCRLELNRRLCRTRNADERNVRRAAARRRQAVRSAGLTLAAAVEIDRLQDAGDVEALRRAAATWSEAERAYAKKRYESEHGLYGPLR